MAALVVTNTFVPSTVIESAKMNTNFDDIETYINNRNSGAATWDVMNAVTGTITTLVVTNLSFLPAGTKMPFYQASPPTGWTAVAVNDKFMRVVTSAGTGGTSGGSGLAPSSTLTLAHTHTVAGHTHTGPSHTHSVSRDGFGTPSGTATNGRVLTGDGDPSDSTFAGYASTDITTGSGGTGATGSASPATDSQLTSTAFQYADFCVGSKD